MAQLREQQGIAARRLEFAVLTAARTGEVLGATWPEFDVDGAIWTLPGERMKGGELHTVHLSERAVEILRGQQKLLLAILRSLNSSQFRAATAARQK